MRIRRLNASYLLLVVLLSACSSPVIWDKPGTTDADFKRDNYECERDQPPVVYCQSFDCIGVKKKLKRMYRDCMESKGWVEQKDKQ